MNLFNRLFSFFREKTPTFDLPEVTITAERVKENKPKAPKAPVEKPKAPVEKPKAVKTKKI